MALFESLKSLLPGKSDDEVNGVINDVRSAEPAAKDEDIVAAVSAQAPKAMANSYVTNKYGLDQRRQLQDQFATENEGPNYAAGLAALGAGLAGGNAAAAGQNVLANKRQGQERQLADFDKNAGMAKDEALAKEENDPNSTASQLARKLATDMGVDPALAQNMTAARFKALSPVLEKKYSIEQARLGRKDANASRADLLADSRAEREAREADRKAERQEKIDAAKTEKEFSLTTPFGLANSVEDAKKLKDASESKAKFDNNIDQMIALREKHKGGNATNRVDVEDGQRLAKDLLLEYKNMASLGVLSKSDEDILNAIIPSDPLKFNSAYEAITGQDPTLARLKSFKRDSDKDFTNRVATRIRGGDTSKVANNPPAPATVPTAPKSGDVEDGYRFKGGDPKDPKNWEEAKDMQMVGVR